MEQEFILRIEKPEVSPESAFKLLKMKLDPEDEDVQTVLAMLREAAALAVPKAMYRVVPVSERNGDSVVCNGITLTSPLVSQNLSKVNRMVAYVATCGTELEEWSLQFTDPLEVYWADGIKMRYLGEANKTLHSEVKGKYFPESDMSVMSPGSLASWPIQEQEPLFRLVGKVKEKIGVGLTESCLMLPSKSVSGFFFSSDSHYENCRFCPLWDCPNRRAPFDHEL